MKFKVLVFVLLLCSSVSQAQNALKIIDSLKTVLTGKPDAKTTATIYSDLTWYYSNVSIDSALQYGQRAVLASRKLGDSVLLAQVHSDVGSAYFRKGDFVKSKQSYMLAYDIRKARKDFYGMAKVNANLASIYQTQQHYNAAMKAYLASLNYFESVNNASFVNVTKVNLGYLFMEMKNYPKAKKYIEEAILSQKKHNSLDELCTSYLNLGNVYLKMNDTVSAMLNYNKSIKICKGTGNSKAMQSALNNIGTVKSGQKKSAAAMAYFAKSQQLREGYDSDLDKASVKLNIARELTANKKYKEALAMLLDIKKLFEKQQSQEDLALTYKLLIPVYANLNQPDSVSLYSNRFGDIKDKLQENLAMKQTTELEAKYQSEKKEKLLIKKESEVKQRNLLLIGTSTLALMIGLIGMMFFRQQKLRNRQQQQGFELKSAMATIETQNKLNEQRLNISRDLHDNIGAQLTFIISSVDNIKYAFDIQNQKLDSKLQNISSFAKSTILELRDTIWAMNNNEITFEDLHSRIFNYIEKAKVAKEDIVFDFSIDPPLHPVKLSSIYGMNIYRTIQEAVNNAIKYSEASRISIEALSDSDNITIRISDNGHGFDVNTVEMGSGLQNMKKRIEDIGGEFNLSSSATGTIITLLLNK